MHTQAPLSASSFRQVKARARSSTTFLPGWPSWYRAALLPVMFGHWPRCSRPALGIWSDGDKFLSEAQMSDSSAQMDAEWAYARIAGCGHWIPKEQPARLASLAIDWFGRYGAAAQTAKQLG